MATEFEALLNDWHSYDEMHDKKIERQIHLWYADAPEVAALEPYFRPSSIGSDLREMYVQAMGAEPDEKRVQPHQGRWTRIGTKVGDIIQRDVLYIEKHGEDVLGYKPAFRFERTPKGQPMFEEFARKNHPIFVGDDAFYLTGSPDGVMIYTSEDGDEIRVGLEVKSKQTTPARTSLFSMKAPEDKHVKQMTAYAEMFNLDYYVIIYVNCAHQKWSMTEAEFAKNPDIRVFGVAITPEMKDSMITEMAMLRRMVAEKKPPMMDITKFTFNNYKTACALSLTSMEVEQLELQLATVMSSKSFKYEKDGATEALAEIKKIRKEGLKTL